MNETTHVLKHLEDHIQELMNLYDPNSEDFIEKVMAQSAIMAFEQTLKAIQILQYGEVMK